MNRCFLSSRSSPKRPKLLESPVAAFVMVVGIFAALKVLKLTEDADHYIGYGSNIAFSLVIFWGVWRALSAILTALDDPVPRVRRNAAHALGCVACKPNWDRGLPDSALQRLSELAANDPNGKVRKRELRDRFWAAAGRRI